MLGGPVGQKKDIMPFKGIAIPPRTTRRGGELSKGYVSATSAPTHPRPVSPNREHRYAAGDRLMMARGGRDISRGASACLVISLLPHEGGPLRYRVQSESESFERIVDEADLSVLEPGLE
jgi:hypothetical protein